MVLESNKGEEFGTERVSGQKNTGSCGVPKGNPHKSDLRPMVCTELPPCLPWKEFQI